MDEVEKLYAQAEILDQVARWSEQPDEPTGAWGVVSAHDLKMRAAALRATTVLYEPAEEEPTEEEPTGEEIPFVALGNNEPIPENWPEELKTLMRGLRGE